MDDPDALVERTLARAGEPLIPSAVRKALPVGSRLALAELRARLPALAKAGRIFRWPGPGRLSEAEKRALIDNGRGGFFDAIGIRLE